MVHIRVIAGVGVADRFMYEAVSLGLFGSAFSWRAFLKSWLCGEADGLNLGVWFGCCGEKLVGRIWVFGYADFEIVDSD
jgi:hypothetical protein